MRESEYVSVESRVDLLVVGLVRGLSVDEDMISDRYVTSDGRFMGDMSTGNGWRKQEEEALLRHKLHIADHFVSIGLACIKGCHKNA